MTLGRLAATAATILTLLTVLIASTFREDRETQGAGTSAPVLSVNVTRAMRSVLPIRVPAAGHVEAWQEASIGTEANGLRLIDVRVNVGDTVAKGDVLLLLEAMKMENEIKAPGSGIVKDIPVAEGARVSEGQVLVVIEAD